MCSGIVTHTVINEYLGNNLEWKTVSTLKRMDYRAFIKWEWMRVCLYLLFFFSLDFCDSWTPTVTRVREAVVQTPGLLQPLLRSFCRALTRLNLWCIWPHFDDSLFLWYNNRVSMKKYLYHGPLTNCSLFSLNLFQQCSHFPFVITVSVMTYRTFEGNILFPRLAAFFATSLPTLLLCSKITKSRSRTASNVCPPWLPLHFKWSLSTLESETVGYKALLGSIKGCSVLNSLF